MGMGLQILRKLTNGKLQYFIQQWTDQSFQLIQDNVNRKNFSNNAYTFLRQFNTLLDNVLNLVEYFSKELFLSRGKTSVHKFHLTEERLYFSFGVISEIVAREVL